MDTKIIDINKLIADHMQPPTKERPYWYYSGSWWFANELIKEAKDKNHKLIIIA